MQDTTETVIAIDTPPSLPTFQGMIEAEGTLPCIIAERDDGVYIEVPGTDLLKVQEALDACMAIDSTKPIIVQFLNTVDYIVPSRLSHVEAKVPERAGITQERTNATAGLRIINKEGAARRSVKLIGTQLGPYKPILRHGAQYGVYAEGVDLTVENLGFYGGNAGKDINGEYAHVFASNCGEVAINNIYILGLADMIGTGYGISSTGKKEGAVGKGLTGIYLLDCKDAHISHFNISATSWDGITLNGTNAVVEHGIVAETRVNTSAGIGITQNGRKDMPLNKVVVRDVEVKDRVKSILCFNNVDVTLAGVGVDYDFNTDAPYGVYAVAQSGEKLHLTMRKCRVRGVGTLLYCTNGDIADCHFTCLSPNLMTQNIDAQRFGPLSAIIMTPEVLGAFTGNKVSITDALKKDVQRDKWDLWQVLLSVWDLHPPVRHIVEGVQTAFEKQGNALVVAP